MTSAIFGVFDRGQLVAELIRDEGIRLKPYSDTVGKLTIGVGRNLDANGISRDEAMTLLQHDIDTAANDCRRSFPWWPSLDDTRQRVLLNMCFNMGLPTLLTFRRTLSAVADGDYNKAADGMLASKWAEQVGDRAKRLAAMMRTGHV